MRPESEADLAKILSQAHGPLSIIGGGSRLLPGEGQGARIEMGALRGVALYEPEALTLVAKAGTPLAEIQDILAAENQMLGFEPDPRPGSTLGGVVAANASGPRRVLAGPCRDAVLGLRFVSGDGDIVKNGGRVMKNVTGYDLARLLAGSRGRLGAITEISLKTTPIAPVRAVLTLDGLGPDAALSAMQAALGLPHDVSAAGWLPEGRLILRLEGLAGSVEGRAAALTKAMAPWGRATLTEHSADIARLRDLPARWQQEAAPQGRVLWRILARPSQMTGLIASLPGDYALDWGGALAWVQAPPDWRPDLPQGVIARRMTALEANDAAPLALPPQAPAIAALEEGLRQRFDRRGILMGAG